MFAKRAFLSKPRTSERAAVSAASEPTRDREAADQDGNSGDVSKEDSVTKVDNEIKQPFSDEVQSFRRGLRDGRIRTEPQQGSKSSNMVKGLSHGRPGLSFTDDIEDDGIHIRKGVTNRIEEPIAVNGDLDSAREEGTTGIMPTLKKQGHSTVARDSVKISAISEAQSGIYLDVEGGNFGGGNIDLEKINSKASRINRHVVGDPHAKKSNRRMLGVISGDSDEEEFEYYDTSAQDTITEPGDSAPRTYEYIALTPFLNSHLEAIKDDIGSIRQKLEATRIRANATRDMPDQHQKVMKDIEENMSIFERVTEEAQALGSLRIAKLNGLNKAIQVLYANRKDAADSYCRMNRWILCDLLRTIGIETDYSCGVLDEIDDEGHDVASGLKRCFERRLTKIEQFKENQRMLAIARVERFLENNHKPSIEDYMAESVTELFTLEVSLESLNELYPSLLELDTVDDHLMDDAFDKYQHIGEALSEFEMMKEMRPEEFDQLKIKARLRPLYNFYAQIDLIKWDPLERDMGLRSSLSEREWFKYMKSFCPDYVARLVQELMLPAAINAIESWDILSAVQSRLLARFLGDVIANLPDDNRNAEIEKLTTVFFKVLEARISVIFPTNVGNVIRDSWISGYLKFQIVQIASNIMKFGDIFTGKSLSNVVLQKLFVERLMPLLDFQLCMDAFAVAIFFACTDSLSPQLRSSSRTNTIIKLTAYTIADRNWESRFDSGSIVDRLHLSFNNSDYRGIIDRAFGMRKQ